MKRLMKDQVDNKDLESILPYLIHTMILSRKKFMVSNT